MVEATVMAEDCGGSGSGGGSSSAQPSKSTSKKLETEDVSLPEGLENVHDSVSHMKNLTNTNFNSLIGGLHFKPVSKSRFFIPLCRLVPLRLVRPILENDVQLLKNEFINGYWEGDIVLYVSIFDEHENILGVSPSETDIWNEHWHNTNNQFESFLSSDHDLGVLSGKMFHVWEGNHRVIARRRHVDRLHGDDPE